MKHIQRELASISLNAQLTEVIDLLAPLTGKLADVRPLVKSKIKTALALLRIGVEGLRATELEMQFSSRLPSRRVSGINAFNLPFPAEHSDVEFEDDPNDEVADWISLQYLPKRQESAPSPSDINASEFLRSTKISNQSVAAGKKKKKAVRHRRTPSNVIVKTGKALGLSTQHPELQKVQRCLFESSVRKVLSRLDNWSEFDIFELDVVSCGKPLAVLVHHLFERLGLIDHLHIPRTVLARFICKVEAGYRQVPYHNATHAADVVHNVYYFIQQDGLGDMLLLEDVFAAILASAVHDYDHPGTNNAFQIATNSDLAIRYNDQSVLENMHCAEAFKCMKAADSNILAYVSPEHRRQLRESVIACVYATDMEHHFQNLAHLQATLEKKKKDGTRFSHTERKDRLQILSTLVHCADLGNPCKINRIYLRWTEKIFEEFFSQGDQEKSLGFPVSPLCDREKPNLERGQIGFFDYIVEPLFKTFSRLSPDLALDFQSTCLKHLAENRQHWQAIIDQQDDKRRSRLHSPPSSSPRASNSLRRLSMTPSSRSRTNSPRGVSHPPSSSVAFSRSSHSQTFSPRTSPPLSPLLPPIHPPSLVSSPTSLSSAASVPLPADTPSPPETPRSGNKNKATKPKKHDVAKGRKQGPQGSNQFLTARANFSPPKPTLRPAAPK